MFTVQDTMFVCIQDTLSSRVALGLRQHMIINLMHNSVKIILTLAP